MLFVHLFLQYDLPLWLILCHSGIVPSGLNQRRFWQNCNWLCNNHPFFYNTFLLLQLNLTYMKRILHFGHLDKIQKNSSFFSWRLPSGSDSRWFLSKKIEKKLSGTPYPPPPPPFMENSIENFHSVFWLPPLLVIVMQDLLCIVYGQVLSMSQYRLGSESHLWERYLNLLKIGPTAISLRLMSTLCWGIQSHLSLLVSEL